MVPPSYRLAVYEIPDDAPIDRLDQADWPEDGFQFPYPDSTQVIGDQWLKSGQSFGLILPSCAVSGGLGEIMVVNPFHEAAQRIRLMEARSDIFNPRAFTGVGGAE